MICLVGAPTLSPLAVHQPVVNVAYQICFLGLDVAPASPNVVKTARSPMRLQVTAQSAAPPPANPGRWGRLDDGSPNTGIACLSVVVVVTPASENPTDHGPISVTAPLFLGAPPESRIGKDTVYLNESPSALVQRAVRFTQ